MSSHHPRAANGTNPGIAFVEGSFCGQVYDGSSAKWEELGRLYAFLALNRPKVPAGTLMLMGRTKAFRKFMRGIKQCVSIVGTQDPSQGSGIEAPVLALGLESSDTTVIMALDPESQHVKRCYRAWLSAGKIPLWVLHGETRESEMSAMSTDGIEAKLNGWPSRQEWARDPQERMIQVIQVIEPKFDRNKTVFLSVNELKDLS